ncbi:MAG: YbaB/EbfC family nucleoid-associated protein [Solobacterium sp.]|nr:YbaB/EbfC family nucleoid-associated protein [Solobacterium sp.]
MDFSKLMEQAQKMQKDLSEMESELSETVYIGRCGGQVVVKVNGRNEMQEIEIADELMTLDNKEMLQDMILIAQNDAVAKAAEDREARLGAATAGIKIPGL